MSKEHLILLHGALGSKDQLEFLKVKLSEQFQAHSFNFEGHGGSVSNQAFSMELFANNVLSYMNENNIEKAHIFGYSMGGYVALNLAINHANLIRKIICFGTKFDWTEESANQEIKMLNPEIIEQKVPAFANHLKKVHHPGDWKEVMYKTANMMLSLGIERVLKESDFEKITNQILITLGSEDNMVSQEESTQVVDLLPNGNFKLIDQFYHPIAKNDTDEMARIIEKFILS